ncbi:cyclophilin-like domain-containing protein [Phakopsora pachyrhizi]|nr:cyclophilin-like domain-containing protein [Phakopsora pachyrhizi]
MMLPSVNNLFVTEPVRSGRVKLLTTNGPIEIDLWARETPLACRNFIQLCLEGYYDNSIFHRVIPGFIIQTGDPTGSGTGGESIYDEGVFKDEINARLKFTRRGLVAMANLGQPNTNSSQFFITLDRTDELQDKHTIFGSVVGDTIYNVLKLTEVEIGKDQRPIHPPKIISTEVIDNPFKDIVPRITSEQRNEQAKAKKEAKKERKKELMKSKHRALAKNKGLLSFAEEEALLKPDHESNQDSRKIRSAHDFESNSQLLNRSPIQTTNTTLESPSKSAPTTDRDNFHQALRVAVKSQESKVDQIDKAVSDDPVKQEPLKKRKSKGKDKQIDDNNKKKAEIQRFEEDLKRLRDRSDDEDYEQENISRPDPKSIAEPSNNLNRVSLLELERDRYKSKSASLYKNRSKNFGSEDVGSSKEGGGDVLSILESFKTKLRKAGETKGGDSKAKDHNEIDGQIDGYSGQVDPTKDGVLGDIDGDDEGWMSHELKFRKDATVDVHKADEYSVIDPLKFNKKTLNELKSIKKRQKV